MLLELRNLSCGYGGRGSVRRARCRVHGGTDVVRGVSFSLQQGRILGIVGPNGAGKTTLFRAMTRLLAPSDGAIYYRGKVLASIPSRELAREVAVLPQMLENTFSFSVQELVAMGRFPHLARFQRLGRKDWDAIERAMSLADVTYLADRMINELSGGERQRTFIAQALAQQPALLLLDEPTAHLDIGHQIEILDLLGKLNAEEGLTVVMILHDLNLASEYCDRIVLLRDGSTFKIGPPQEVLTREAIEEVYNTPVIVYKNPVSSKPHLMLIPRSRQRDGNPN